MFKTKSNSIGALPFLHKQSVIAVFALLCACETPKLASVVEAPADQSIHRIPAAASVEVIRVASYPEAIAVVRSTSQPRTLVIHLHGFVFGHPRDRAVTSIIKDMEFERIINAQPDAMIIVPSSTGKNTTYNQRFTTAKQLEDVISDVLQQQNLTLENFDHVVLSGHSGAYKTIGRVLKTMNKTVLAEVVDRIALFDATYGAEAADYVKWVGRTPLRHCLQVVFRANTPTQRNALALKQALLSQTQGQPESCYAIFPSRNDDHWKTVPTHFSQLVFP